MCTHAYTREVEQIGARELRANLASAVRQAGAGARVVITLDGHPVAQLGPLEPAGAPSLTDLAAAGLVEPPRHRDRPAPPDALDAAVDVRLDRVLAEVRGG
jgi:antitoxin (DNA-binding transcriptional repressor) of toxin-antitoxin stability system